jgi:glutaminase
MNTFSGQWNFNVRLPAKAALSGVTILVVPNVMGIAVWAPTLDVHCNSIKASKFLCRFVSEFGFDTQDFVYGDGLLKHQEIGKSVHQDHLIYHAAQGSLKGVRRMLCRGVNPNIYDYDQRTPLHLAASNGHTEVVQYLLHHGADPDNTDRNGNKPIDDAKRGGHKEVIALLD